MSSEWAIQAQAVGKCYQLFEQPADRLKQLLWGRWAQGGQGYAREFWALRDVSFAIGKGEVVGIVGRNGAGKSTLLQMVCGTLAPSTGDLQVRGRVAALLELGAGFNPDFTGLENIAMNAAILGMSATQVQERMDGILAFADIGDFVRQPVRTYSSGMFMRLAFAVATSVEPDILVIDEALSVGDGAFARKSFDRIMQLKDGGATILFCSHSMYQVEALCSRALWIDAGQLRMIGAAATVTSAYQSSLNGLNLTTTPAASQPAEPTAQVAATPAGCGRIDRIEASVDGLVGRRLELRSGVGNLQIVLGFSVGAGLAPPSVAFGFSDSNGLTVSSVLSLSDGVQWQLDAHGHGQAVLHLPRVPLLKGHYRITAFLLSEDGLHVYEQVDNCVELHVSQTGPEQGLMAIPHEWRSAV